MTRFRIQLLTATFFSGRILLGEMFDQKQSTFNTDLIKQKILDENHPTSAAKRSNNVGLSKVGTLHPTLFDSLAKALHSLRRPSRSNYMSFNFHQRLHLKTKGDWNVRTTAFLWLRAIHFVAQNNFFADDRASS